MDIARYKKPIIITTIIIAVALIGWLVYFYFFTFSILSTSPSSDRVAIQSPTIKIQTNRTISNTAIKFDDHGAGIVASVNHFNKTVVINLYQNMVSERTYTITLQDITSNDGYAIDTFTYTFIPKNDDSLLSDEDKNIILERQDDKPAVVNDPVANATPLSTDSYVIKSTLNATPDGKGSVSLVATIFLTREDMIAGRDASIATYQAEITARLALINGYTPEKYPITYIIQDP